MAEFSVSFDLVKKDDLGNVSKIHCEKQTACYSGLFGYEARTCRYGIDYDFIHAHYWNLNKDRTDSDWFIKEFVMKHLTKRIDPNIIKYYVREEEPWVKNIYWQTLEVDLSKIGATDLYMLLMLFRYPQENPSFPTVMRKLVEKENDDIEWAFAKSHAKGVEVGYGHLIMHDSTPFIFAADPKRRNNGWSFIKTWNKLRKEPSYKEDQNKYFGINNHFIILE